MTQKSTEKRPFLSVVIPFYNEEESCLSVCEEVDAVLADNVEGGWELIMVNDGSKDQTPEILDNLAKKHSHFRAVHLIPNSGQSAGLEAGFRAARGKIIGTLDGDGQNDPRDLLPLIEEMQKLGVDMMCGIRQKRADSAFRRFQSRVANRIRSRILGDNISDVGCSLRVFRRRVVRDVGFFRHAHRYFPALVQMRGFQVAEIPVNHRSREKGVSKYGGGFRSRAFVGIVDLMGVYWLKKRAHNYRTRETR